MADSFDINHINGQADAIWQSAFAKYGGDPNPQIAASAMQLGATPDVVAAINNSDPNSDNSLAALMNANPSGSTDGSFAKPRNTTNATQNNPYSYNRDDYRKAQDDLMSKDSGLRDTFADVNGVPIANIQYANDTLYWVGKDSKQAKAWQKHMIDSGIYKSNSLSGRQSADGQWTDSDTQAFYYYMAQMGMPDAIHGKDEKTKSMASTSVQYFMAQLGQADWTPDAMLKATGQNPKDQRALSVNLFNNWLLAHPLKKEDGGAMQDRINEYVDLYGHDALPKEIQDLGGGNWVSKLAGIPGGVLHGLSQLGQPILNLESKLNLPGDVGPKTKEAQDKEDAAAIAKGGVSGAVADIFGSGQARSLAIDAHLTADEQAQFAPVVSKAVGGQDYLTEAGNWWGHQTTKLQLATLYAAGDVFSGKDFSSNPFDNAARAWSGGTAHEDNFLMGLNPQFVKDHPDYANVVNFGASFIDPTVVVGAASRVLSAGRFQKTLEIGSGMSKDQLIKNGVPLSTIDKIQYVLAPKRTMNKMRDAAIPSLLRGAKNSLDRQIILGAQTEEQRALVMKMFHDDKGAYKTSLSDREIQQTIETHFDHVYDAGSTWYNFRQSVAMTSPNVIKKMDSNKLIRGLTMGAWDFGHQSMNFSHDTRGALEKMYHDGILAGVPEEDLNKMVDAINADPTKATDIATDFYKKMFDKNPELLARIQSSRSSKWNGLVPDSIMHQYAVDPKGPVSTSGVGEVSKAPLKVPADMQPAFDAMKNATEAIQHDFMAAVEIYQKKLGFAMGNSKETNAPIVERFLSDPANKSISDKYMADKANIEKEMFDTFGTSTGERGTPMLEQQLAALYHAPVSTWEMIAATHGKLDKLERFQEMARMNRIMDMWKVFTLAKPSSAMRALIGDDSARVAVTLAFAGSPKAAASYTAARHIQSVVKTPVDAILALTVPAAKAWFGVEEHLRGQLMTKLRELTGMSKEEAEAASKNWYDKQMESLGPLAVDMHRIAEQTDHTGGFHPVGPGMPGHAESLPWWVRSIGAGPGRDWAKIYDEQGPEAARKFLEDHRLDPKQSKESIALNIAKGATKEDIHAIQTAGEHAQTATEFQAALDQADASMPRYIRGPKKGQIDYANKAAYRKIFGGMPKVASQASIDAGIKWMKDDIADLQTQLQGANAGRVKEINSEIAARQARIAKLNDDLTRTKKYPNLHMGDFRGRIEARIQYHKDLSTDLPQIVLEQARNEHAFYEKMLAMPELRDMVKSGHVKQKALDKMVKNPVTRAQLPWIIATEDSPRTRQAIDRIIKKPASATMDHVFRPMITSGRADGMKRIVDWWQTYLTEYYKNNPHWDAARITKEAEGMGYHWMRNNTYQGARTIGSYALRNVMPFSGSVMNQDKFWLNTFKAHPWAAGVAAKLGLKADEHRNDKVTLPNPLGWAHVGGDNMTINPLGWSFIGSEGMGSMVPGLGPFVMPFAAMAQQNAFAKQVMDTVPGWSNYLPPDASLSNIATSVIPSYIRKAAVAGALAAGVDQRMIPGAEKLILDRTKIDEAMGQRPSEDQVRHEVAMEQGMGAAASWVLPVQPHIGNVTLDMIKKASSEEAGGTSMAQIRANPAYKDIAPYLEYRDPTTDPKRKDEIAAQYPQVIAWAAGTHETKGTTNAPTAATASEFNDLSTSGSEHFLSAGELDKEIHDSFQVSQFFQAYDQAYVPMRDKFLTDNEVNTSSQEYKDYKASTLDPLMKKIKSAFPAGYDKFIGGSKSLSNEMNTQAISSLNAFYHMPTTSALDSEGVNNWRYVTDYVSQTVQNIVDAKSSGASTADLQAISDQFQQTIDQHFQGNTAFLDEIGMRYHWSSWKDFLTQKANEEIKANA